VPRLRDKIMGEKFRAVFLQYRLLKSDADILREKRTEKILCEKEVVGVVKYFILMSAANNFYYIFIYYADLHLFILKVVQLNLNGLESFGFKF
jgi:hypothetical protein